MVTSSELPRNRRNAVHRHCLLVLAATSLTISGAGALAAQSEAFGQPSASRELSRPWVGGYVPGWNQGRIDPQNDFSLSSITHYLQFAVFFRAFDGTVDLQTNQLTPAKMRAIVDAAHRVNKKALLVLGGEGAERGLRIAATPQHLQDTLASILSLANRYGYDGIDVDWEPLPADDTELYGSLVEGLRSELDREGVARGRKLLLTTAIEVSLNDTEYMSSLLQTLRRLDRDLDQINVMTYTMATPAHLPFVWHNSALFPDSLSGQRGFRTPSADGAMREFLAAGFPPGKLGIGIDLYGYLWQGQDSNDISALGKPWKIAPKITELSCREVAKYSARNPIQWDEHAEAAYISMPQTNQLISYEDRRGIEAKLEYVQQNGLGGVIVWDIGTGRRGDRAKRELLRAIDDGLFLSRPLRANQVGLR
jgi:chitinase